LKKSNREKNLIKQLKILKNRPVWFWFYKPETEKPNPNQKKRVKIEPNREKPSQIEKSSQTGLNRFLSKKSNRNWSV